MSAIELLRFLIKDEITIASELLNDKDFCTRATGETILELYIIERDFPKLLGLLDLLDKLYGVQQC